MGISTSLISIRVQPDDPSGYVSCTLTRVHCQWQAGQRKWFGGSSWPRPDSLKRSQWSLCPHRQVTVGMIDGRPFDCEPGESVNAGSRSAFWRFRISRYSATSISLVLSIRHRLLLIVLPNAVCPQLFGRCVNIIPPTKAVRLP